MFSVSSQNMLRYRLETVSKRKNVTGKGIKSGAIPSNLVPSISSSHSCGPPSLLRRDLLGLPI